MTPQSDWKAELGAVVYLHGCGPPRRCVVEVQEVRYYRVPPTERRRYGVVPWPRGRYGDETPKYEAGVVTMVDGSEIEVEQP